jgi:hypothetical protein
VENDPTLEFNEILVKYLKTVSEIGTEEIRRSPFGKEKSKTVSLSIYT